MASSRNKLIVRLKDELQNTIELVTHARESLTNELSSEWAQKKLSVDDKFLKKLKELTASFNSLTESKIRLDKAEKAIEEDMTPAEEQEAVMRYLADLTDGELRSLVARAKELKSGKLDLDAPMVPETMLEPGPKGNPDDA